QGLAYEETEAVFSSAVEISTDATLTSDAGEYQILVAGAAATNYNISFENALLTISKANQEINVEEIGDKIITDPPFEIMASTTSGLSLSYQINGPATLSGTTISLTGESGIVTVTVSQEGNINYEAASVEINFMVTEETRLSQIINFEILDSRTFGDAPFELVANSDSGLPVSFESLNSNILSIAGNLASIHGAGEVVIIARQEGNDEYMPADAVERILVINKSTQEISFEEIPTQSFETGFVTPQASSSSGLPVTIEILEGPVEWLNNNLVFISAGFVKLVATQAGNENYLAANPVESEFQIELINGLFDINKEINIYPNPNNGIFEIKSLAESRRIIQIYDPIGIEVYRIETTEENVQVDITSLPIGAYFLKIFESNTQETIFLKIIKN
ncbi:MAG: T9SS type A sorting domain-containing protein, partial [Cytophagales bacterium]